MTSAQAARGAASAWQFLKNHPDYIVDWWMAAAGMPRPDGEPFPIRIQTETDLEAAAWGLAAWEDPLSEDGPASPFWDDAPMSRAVPDPGGGMPFAALVRSDGSRLEGLRLRDGALILKVERGAAAVQIRIEDGDAFDPEGCLALLLPYDLELRMRLSRAGDLAAIAGPKAGSVPSPGRWRASFCSPSKASWQRSPIG